MKNNAYRNYQSGATAPVTLIMLAIIGLIAILTLLFIRGSTVAAHRQYYARLASVGAESAVNLAKQKFTDNPDYAGNGELTLLKTADYRVTVSSEVVSVSLDGLSKTIRGRGTVYVNDVSPTEAYTYDSKTATIYTYAKTKTPEHFGPLAWYDASQARSITQAGTATATVQSTTPKHNGSDPSAQTYEELLHNGGYSDSAWQSDDLSLNGCESREISESICDRTATKYSANGIIFTNITIPRAAPIVQAQLRLPLHTVADGAVATSTVCGFYNSATDPHPVLFNRGQPVQLTTRITDPNLHTQQCVDFTVKSATPSNAVMIDVAPIVTEAINHTGWQQDTPATIGFYMLHTAGDGAISIAKSGISLAITYGTITTPSTGGQIAEWLDVSGHGHHLRTTPNTPHPTYTSGTASEAHITFTAADAGALLPTTTELRAYTVLAVLRARSDTDQSYNVLQAVKDDFTLQSMVHISAESVGIAAWPWSLGKPELPKTAHFICGRSEPDCTNKPVVVNVTTYLHDQQVTTKLRANGTLQSTVTAPADNKTSLNVTGFLIGDSRSQDLNLFEMQIYDSALSCRDAEPLEQQLRAKWGIAAQAWESNCPAQQIPQK